MCSPHSHSLLPNLPQLFQIRLLLCEKLSYICFTVNFNMYPKFMFQDHNLVFYLLPFKEFLFLFLFLLSSEPDVYDQALSNLVAGSTLESTIPEILKIGGGNWDREAVMCALRAA
ncbi:hypothetical protein DM860_001171 [Cuscuta australis]|uniref:Uncharacterized protein n=1 Tax=Cuscuta australis TaxID=267555 RepID=A0A328DXF0_9ASTE|nr:hypothetical protein DM860_001171 [Cuscuta australis]